jgi:phosphoribosylformimino-5-aminoimidazole carboxamide ribotide isomerase
MTADLTAARLLPVIDILGGQVVHAVRGDRQLYRPLVSRLTPSYHPVEVALAIRRLGLSDLYVADLDALEGRQPDWHAHTELKGTGVSLWVDAGIRSVDQSLAIRHVGADKVILALESLPSPRLLTDSLALLGPESLVFSLDMREGVALTLPGVWSGASPEDIAAEVIGMGIRQVILLDVANVGTGKGTGTSNLCERLHARFPKVTLITGGGINTWGDVREQVRFGAARVLVATALHEGRLP